MFNKSQLSKDLKAAKEPKKLARPKDKFVVPGAPKVDPNGYWDPANVGRVIEVPLDKDSRSITMSYPDGTPLDQPLIGIGTNTGMTQYMMPGQDYIFPDDKSVIEYPKDQMYNIPLAEAGGTIMELDDYEIKMYRDAGYVIEDMPTAQDGTQVQTPPNPMTYFDTQKAYTDRSGDPLRLEKLKLREDAVIPYYNERTGEFTTQEGKFKPDQYQKVEVLPGVFVARFKNRDNIDVDYSMDNEVNKKYYKHYVKGNQYWPIYSTVPYDPLLQQWRAEEATEQRNGGYVSKQITHFQDGGNMAPRSMQYGGPATAADSSMVAANARRVLDFYKASGNYNFGSNSLKPYAWPSKYVWDKIQAERKRLSTPSGKKDTATITYNPRPRVVPTHKYWSLPGPDPNKVYAREEANAILNVKAPMSLYDRRIGPQYYADMLATKGDTKDDAVQLYMYDPLAITPAAKLTDAEIIKRYKKFGASGIPESKLIGLGLVKKPVTSTTEPTVQPTAKTTGTTAKPSTSLKASPPTVAPKVVTPPNWNKINMTPERMEQMKRIHGEDVFQKYNPENLVIYDLNKDLIDNTTDFTPFIDPSNTAINKTAYTDGRNAESIKAYMQKKGWALDTKSGDLIAVPPEILASYLEPEPVIPVLPTKPAQQMTPEEFNTKPSTSLVKKYDKKQNKWITHEIPYNEAAEKSYQNMEQWRLQNPQTRESSHDITPEEYKKLKSKQRNGGYVNDQLTHFQDGDTVPSVVQKPEWYQEPNINPSAFVGGYREQGEEPSTYKYGFFDNAGPGSVIAGGGLGIPKYGLEGTFTGVIPTSPEDFQYFRGNYDAGVSKQLNDFNIGLGVNTSITGYPGEQGFVRDPLRFEPRISLKYNIHQDGGNTDPGNNALDLHMFYDKNNFEDGGSLEYQVGDEVDEATYQYLKSIGYEFE